MTARSVLGLWPERAQVEGSVRVAGTEVVGAARRELLALRRSEVSMIFQDPRAGINPLRRIGDFLTESLTAQPPHEGRPRARERAIELLRRRRARTTPNGTCASSRTSSPAGCCSG